MVSKLYWATLHRELGKLAMDVLGAEAEILRGAPVRALAPPAALPLQPRRHHLRGLQRDPEEHHRRAGARPAARAERVQMIPSMPAGPRPPPGKTVLVTAAAGTGIGFAAAKRCAEEGAAVVLSDVHERRLGEAAEKLEAVLGRRPPTIRCDVDGRGRRPPHVRRRRVGARAPRRPREQRRPRGDRERGRR